ncbi:MAG: helix-turn-helix domain-containing protein [Deltaproteobacteria bacterium]|nr:helix-turn-helix domain-containing protein [Deltaproteobacteria bacterium]
MRVSCRVKEVAQALNVSPITIYRMVSDGRLKAVRIGKALRFTPADLKAFLGEERYKELFEVGEEIRRDRTG